jgi:hypothetical protein
MNIYQELGYPEPHELKTGQIILVHNGFELKYPLSLLYWAVRKITSSFWNHCVIIWKVGNHTLIVEGLETGIIVTHYDIWIRRRNREIEVVGEPTDSDTLIRSLGLGYDFSNFFIHTPYRILTGGKWIGKSSETANRKLLCSELAALIQGWEHSYKTTPKDIAKRFNLNRT